MIPEIAEMRSLSEQIDDICDEFYVDDDELSALLQQNADEIPDDSLRDELKSSEFNGVIFLLADRIEKIAEMNPNQVLVLTEMVKNAVEDWTKRREIECLYNLYIKLMDAQDRSPMERRTLAGSRIGNMVYRRMRLISQKGIWLDQRYKHKRTGITRRIISFTRVCLIKLAGREKKITPDELLKNYEHIPDDQ